MKYMRRLAPLAILYVALTLVQHSAFSKAHKEWHGYLIDRMCMKAVASSVNPLDFVYHHTKDCVLMPACKKKGFTLYLAKEKKWLHLNKKGNELAEKIIVKSKRNSAFYVSVKGILTKNGVLEVDAIQEIEAKEHQK
tara:strand:- start:92 stop:502 length:411 start_codon:yes stop_codon:yes gene_type:complete